MVTSDWLLPRTRPLNIGHRGAMASAPQNTLAAFRKAVEFGADGVELDVHLSKDVVVVVIHDFYVDRTTDGTGRVAQKTLAELKALDAGEKFSPEFAGERIPTLSKVFDVLEGKLLVNVELKAPDRSRDTSLVAPVLEVVREHGMERRVLFSSFNSHVLRAMKQLAPDIPIGLLYAPDSPMYARRAWLDPFEPHEARNPHYSLLTGPIVRWYHGRGLRINTWTVNEPDEMRRLIEAGVDAIITNKPDVLKDVLRET
jgi:glycerophosphoryl diester phosphodiesterase